MFRSRDVTQNSFEETQANPKKRKRNRETLSCLQCRDRKVACDRARPCSNCIRYKRQSSCSYASTNPNEKSEGEQHHTNGSIRRPNSDAVEERISKIEQRLSGMADATSRSSTTITSTNQSPATMQLNDVRPSADGGPSIEQSLSRGPHPVAGSDSGIAATKETLAGTIWTIAGDSQAQQPGDTLEENILGRGYLGKKPTSGRPFYVGPAAWSSIAPFIGLEAFAAAVNYGSDSINNNPQDWGAGAEDKIRFRDALMPQWKRLFSICSVFGQGVHDTILNFASTSILGDSVTELLRVVPADDECRSLVLRFLESANQIFPIVFRSEFEDELTTFLQDRRSVSHHWLSLLVAVLAIGYVVPVNPLTEERQAFLPDIRRATELAVQAQQHTFIASAASHRSPLATFQALLVLVLSKHLLFGWNDSNDGVSGLLGLAGRLACPLGLHRDPTHFRTPQSMAEQDLRRKLYTTYLFLEMDQCLRTGCPLYIRSADFDIKEPEDDLFQAIFLREYGLLSSIYQLTHSSSTSVSIKDVAEKLKRLRSAAQTVRTSIRLEKAHSHDLVPIIRLSILAIAIDRLHVAILIQLHALALDIRIQVTTDMLGPAIDILECTNSLASTLCTLAPQETQKGWQIFILSQIRSTLYNASAYTLGFLQKTLADPALLAAKGASPDSSQIFRTIRSTLKFAGGAIGFSRISVKGQCAFSSFLRAVQERFRLYVDKGQGEIDLLSDEGRPVMEAIIRGMDEEMDEAELAVTELWGEPDVQLGTDITNSEAESGRLEWQNQTDPTLLDGFEWPWTDIMADPIWTVS